MVTAEQLDARHELIADSADLQALHAHLRAQAQPVIERMPHIPERKALLSTDGGICPDDGAILSFDPWSPTEHRCPRCGKRWQGERHDLHWARYQHLWVAERAAHLAALASVGSEADQQAAAARAREILMVYVERYWGFPNRDNALGPSRLFFSTYLESMWACNYVAAAALLRDVGMLDEAAVRGVNQVAEEAATLIGDFDEGFSNRQTWNNAALAAIAAWFEDDELAQRAIESETGLIAHLVRGYGRDGMWYEGENYHLFALRGWMTGMGWARRAGVDLSDARLATRLTAALRAPALSALPDYTFPARKDSRFGISLAQPSFMELWEVGLAWLGSDDLLASWLAALYASPAQSTDSLDWYLHDAGFPESAPRGRRSLSWWSLLEMLPALPDAAPWKPPSTLFENQGLAVLRSGDRYASLECGAYGGGHGHPDRLHLTLHAGGVHWLADPGTGTYVARDLFWYRSTLAHNAPRLDASSQPPQSASCDCFDEQEGWAWVRGRYGTLSRSVVLGPEYIIDLTDLSGREDRLVELPWHFAGRSEVETDGRWVSGELPDEFVSRVERFVPATSGPIVISCSAPGAQLTAHLLFDGELLRAEGPGLPGKGERALFYVMRARGRNAKFVSVLEVSRERNVRTVRLIGDSIEVERSGGIDRHRFSAGEWSVDPQHGQARALHGTREQQPPFQPLLQLDPPVPVSAVAFHVASAPPLDGTLEQFETTEPLQLGLEDQYRRSEEGYPGPDEMSAVAYAGWDETALFLAIDVSKPEIVLRAADAAPLLLDNEPDDIHSDGVQVYIADRQRDNGEGGGVGYLIVPEPAGGRVRGRATSDSTGATRPADVRGGWRRTDTGYRLTVAIPWPEGFRPHAGARVRFDLIVNEMLPGRARRAGQLVWSGGGGWVFLRGDRQDPARFGILELVG